MVPVVLRREMRMFPRCRQPLKQAGMAALIVIRIGGWGIHKRRVTGAEVPALRAGGFHN